MSETTAGVGASAKERPSARADGPFVHVGKSGRVYTRRFDHDQARTRYAAGETTSALASEYGVSWAAVQRVVNPEAGRRMDRANRAFTTRVCEECRGVARFNPSQRPADGRVLCRVCRGKARRTTLEYTAGGLPVGSQCVTCREWKDLSEFQGGDRFRDVRPEGVRGQCVDCTTAARARYRDANKVPCQDCGVPVEGKGRSNTRSGPNGTRVRLDASRPYLCLPCAMGRHVAAARASASSADRAPVVSSPGQTTRQTNDLGGGRAARSGGDS